MSVGAFLSKRPWSVQDFIERGNTRLSEVMVDRLRSAYLTARTALLAERTPEGFWIGELSASALSTATAVSALTLIDKHGGTPERHSPLIAGGLAWLAAHQNEDARWGDTIKTVT